jgi:LysM repeat protein
MKFVRVFLAVVVLFTMVGGASSVSAAPRAPSCSDPYTVRWGDTLAKIAARCNSTVAILIRANPQIANPNRIYPGQLINVLPVHSGVPLFTQVKVFLIAPGSGAPGNIGCGDLPVAVTRNVSATTAPLTAAIGQLIGLRDQYYGQSGLFNSLYQSSLSIESVTLVNGVATIRLRGSFLIGGACQGPMVQAVFDRTAKQFSTVKTVNVYINGRPLVDILSEEA